MLRRFLFTSQISDAIAHTFNSLLGYSKELSKDKIGTQTRQIQQGRGIFFDGVDDYIQLPNVPAYNLTSFTIASWFVASAKQNTRGFSKDNINDSPNRKIISFKPATLGGNQPAGGIFIGGVFEGVTGPSNITPGTINHLALVREVGVAIRLYLNGVLIASTPNTLLGAIDSNIGPTIGNFRSNTSTGEFFDSSLRDMRVYNVPKNLEQIQAIMNGERDVVGIVSHHKLDEQAGTIAYDSSGNGYHGVRVNGVSNVAYTSGFGSDYQNQVGYTLYHGFAFASGRYLRNTVNTINFNGDFSLHTIYSSTFPSSLNNYLFSAGPTSQRVQLDRGGPNYRVLFTNPANIAFDTGILVRTQRTKITIVKTGTSWACYENGILRNTFTYSFPATVSGISIGTDSTPGSATDGRMERLQAWTRALTAGEILSIQDTQNPTPTGALLDYKLDGNTRNTGSGANATVIGTPTYFREFIPRNETTTTQDVLGNTLEYSGRVKYDAQLRGRYYTFNGVNQYAVVNNSSRIMNGVSFSFCVFLRVKSFSSGSTVVFNKYNADVNRAGMHLFVGGTTTSFNSELVIGGRAGNTTGSGYFVARSGFPISLNRTYNVIGRKTGSTIEIHIDGVLVGSVTAPEFAGSLANSTNLHVGSFSPSNLFTNIDVRDFQLFNRSITNQEIIDIYNGQYVPSDQRYNMSEGTGTIMYNSSNTLDNGTLVNGVQHNNTKGVGSVVFHNLGHTNNGGVFAPRNEASPTQDVLGNPLQYKGDSQSLLPTGQADFNYGLAPELIRKSVPTSYNHGNTLPITMTKKIETYREKDFIILS